MIHRGDRRSDNDAPESGKECKVRVEGTTQTAITWAFVYCEEDTLLLPGRFTIYP